VYSGVYNHGYRAVREVAHATIYSAIILPVPAGVGRVTVGAVDPVPVGVRRVTVGALVPVLAGVGGVTVGALVPVPVQDG
jgi:hypothetical protein